MNAKRRQKERIFEGLAVSPGVAVGPAHIRESGELSIPDYQIPEDRLEEEGARFHDAVGRAIRQVGKLKAKALSFHGAAAEELGYLLAMLKAARLSVSFRVPLRAWPSRRNSSAMAAAQ